MTYEEKIVRVKTLLNETIDDIDNINIKLKNKILDSFTSYLNHTIPAIFADICRKCLKDIIEDL